MVSPSADFWDPRSHTTPKKVAISLFNWGGWEPNSAEAASRQPPEVLAEYVAIEQGISIANSKAEILGVIS